MNITVDGQQHPVTPAWHAQNVAPYPEFDTLTLEQLLAERDRLLHQSDRAAQAAPGVTYGVTDEARLQAVTCVYNAHRATRVFMATRGLDEFGFDGVDQLHGNSHGYPCGCTLHVVFDHHKAIAGEEVEHHPHHPLKVCPAHNHLAGDFKAHYAKVLGDHAPGG